MKLISHTLNTSLEFIKGVGPIKADLLQKELGVATYGQYLLQFPFRHEDRSTVHRIVDAQDDGVSKQLAGVIISKQVLGMKKGKRLVCVLQDETSSIELVWFKGIAVMDKIIKINQRYIIHGKIKVFNRKKSIVHPELETAASIQNKISSTHSPIYPSTDKLRNKGLDNRVRRNIVQQILAAITPNDIPEILPLELVEKYKLMSRFEAVKNIHLPESTAHLEAAKKRIKFEEILLFHLQAIQSKIWKQVQFKGNVFAEVGTHFNNFYKHHLGFDLTNAQKRVMREIRADLGSGTQMNRLLQGDVGSGKTIIALLACLLAKDNHFQSCILAPTEILALQHFHSIESYLKEFDIRIGFLSGSIKGKKRESLFEALEAGEIDILIGTHAILEDKVKFHNLGLAITDEQHRFGVKQRSKLWEKSKENPPHILVMTATPIPRTLAMTVYGDLDVSIIDELPPGRKPVLTLHKTETYRIKIMKFMKAEIAKGRQVYVVYPLIEESEKLDLQNLQQGYERLLEFFPRPNYQISIVHGKMKAADKALEMDRFVRGETQIMVATTVIEVGVNVPNASVMVIENAERFGLSQLHQLRGRVGRGAEKSYCILASSYKLSKEAKFRLNIMVETNDGFRIAEADMELRGPGNIDGTKQSGILDLALINLSQDKSIVQASKHISTEIIKEDPRLELPKNKTLVQHLARLNSPFKTWGKIS